jgi:hypothetical protein
VRQTGVDDFLDAPEFGPPGFLHIVEALIEVDPRLAQPGIYIVQPRVHVVEPHIHVVQARVIYENANQYGQRWHADGQEYLKFGHHQKKSGLTHIRPVILIGMRRLCLLVATVSLLRADERTQKLIARLSEEADAFRRIAPQVLGEETLHQRALKAPPRFRPRIGNAAKQPPKPTWQQREIQSEYTFASFTGEQGAIHELRQVTAIDGKKVEDSKNAERALARAITAKDDERKKQMLKDFEKHGLTGAATDFGQMILLFAPRDIVRYEFTYLRTERRGEAQMLVFGYKQIDGNESLTLVDGRKGDLTIQMRLAGEVWVWESNYFPVRITLAVGRGDGGEQVREEAVVEYTMSQHGALLPTSTEHRELRAGQLVAENHFTYGEFKRFGASSDIKFDVEPDGPVLGEPEPRR